MGHHERGADGAVKIRPGDTLSAIVAEWHPDLDPAKRQKLWHAFFRKLGPPPEPVKDPNTIYAGETLYFRPDLTGAASAAKQAARPVTEGVKNPRHRDARGKEADSLNADLQQATTFILNAIAALQQIERRPKVEAWFREVFIPDTWLPVGGDGRKDVLEYARTAVSNFQKMQKAAGRVRFGVQETMPVTANGYAIAYADVEEKRVVVWGDGADPRSYSRQSQSFRGHVLVHELAHVAFGAGHGLRDSQAPNVLLFSAPENSLDDAEAYAVFASRLRQYVR